MKRVTGAFLALCIFFTGIQAKTVYAAEVSAKACVLMEAATGRVLYEKNARQKLPMASTTKIMTTLLTIESGDLDAEFLVDSAAIHVEGSSMGLQEGDYVSRRDLCYGMLLPSGNDAANAAAVSVSGDIPSFIERMNERAEEIGMTRTCFVTPSGLDGEGHGASAYDMALLTREAMRNPEFRSICAQTSAAVQFGNPPYDRTLYNSNKLLTMYEGVIGVKTGFTDEAGRCLVSACERDGVTLLCVTLNAPDDWNDHIKLYDTGFSGIENAELAVPDALCIPIAGGTAQQVALQPSQTVNIGAWEGDTTAVHTRVLKAPFAYAPIAAGEELGTLEYYYETNLIAAVPLCAAEDVAALPEPEPEHPLLRFWHWLCGRM